LPYFRMQGFAFLLLSCCLGTHVWLSTKAWPEAPQRKWVVLRGAFGWGQFLFGVIAVQIGAPLGDLAALQSVNVVAAALLGRMFLSEVVRYVHGLAICCAVVGAVLVSKPPFLFGSGDAIDDAAWPGHILALLSGMSKAGIFIASRKCPTAAPSLLTLATVAQASIVFMVLPLTRLVDEHPSGTLTASASGAIGWFTLLVISTGFATLLISAGSQLCPAAASAIINNSACMAFGYILQVTLYDNIPSVTTACGCMLMFASIVLMSVFRDRPKPAGGPKGVREETTRQPRDADGAAKVRGEGPAGTVGGPGACRDEGAAAATATEPSGSGVRGGAAAVPAATAPRAWRREGAAAEGVPGCLLGGACATASCLWGSPGLRFEAPPSERSP